MLKSLLKPKNLQNFIRYRYLCTKTSNENETSDVNLGNIASKYQIFRDEDSEMILDVVEERQKFLEIKEKGPPDPFEGLNLERGKAGVFDIEDLVDLLKRENANDIFVASVPAEYNYVDFICVVSGKSFKHMTGIAQFVRKLYKHKRHEGDAVPKLEGANSKDWLALDLGNIALHIFSKEARNIYDLDSLWSLGPEFDKENQKKNNFSEILHSHSIYLDDLKPANASS